MTWGATIHKKPTKPWKEKCFLQRPKLEIDSVSRLVECNVQISLALIWIDKFFLSYVIIFCSKICCFLGLFLFVICAIISEVYWGFKIASPQRYFGSYVETTLTSSICLFFVCHSILFCMSTQDMVCKYRIRTDALVLCNFRRRKRYFVLLIDLDLHDL